MTEDSLSDYPPPPPKMILQIANEAIQLIPITLKTYHLLLLQISHRI